MSKIQKRQTQALAAMILVVAVVIIIATSGILTPRVGAGTSGENNDPPSATELASALIRVGLDAESLTAAGVTASQSIESIIDDVRAYMTDNPSIIDQADADYASARRDVDHLQRLIESGRGTQANVSAYQSATQELTTAQSQRQSALDDVFEAGTESLSETTITTLSTTHTNRTSLDTGCDWNQLPTEFLTSTRTESNWVTLRAAHANETYCNEVDETIDDDSQTVLLSTRAETPVANAATNLDTYLNTVRNTWTNAINNEG